MTDPRPCLKCLALVNPADLPAHEAWHHGLTESIVATVVLKMMKGGSS